MDTNTQQAVENFLSDNTLSELCEVLKIGDDLLDVINLSENQHSDILAWMFDPREGHGQGDQILRDLLLGASSSIAESSSLDGRSTTARFFSEWPPSRIRTASFGSVFTARELGMKASERVDLFVIDPANKFVLLIENKAGSAHSEAQLNGYRDSWQQTVANHTHLKEYSCVLIALDREFKADDDSHHPSNGYWLHMGYDWLKNAAGRALLQQERGNTAARLVVSYCNRQSNWESPLGQRATALAAQLHEMHPAALKYLLGLSTGRLEKNWLDNRTQPAKMFLLQNKAVFSLLRQTQGMASLKETLANKVPDLQRDNIAHARAWLNVCPPGWEKYEGDCWWPVYFDINYSDPTHSKYDITLVLDVGYANSEAEGELLREQLKKFNSGFVKHQSRTRRRVLLNENISVPELVKNLAEHFIKLLKVAK